MSKRKRFIESKPTQYANILFRSRLEARWAVFLDHAQNVLNWEYEPITWHLPNGWKYTPDFRIKICFEDTVSQTMFLEIKPSLISSSYSDVISRFAASLKVRLAVIQGSLWNDGTLNSHIYNKDKRPQPLDLTLMFTQIDRAFKAAINYRFDLED